MDAERSEPRLSGLDELYGRLALCDAFLGFLRRQDDPRAPDAIVHYEAQRAVLVRRIQAQQPPPVVVQAKLGHLHASSPGSLAERRGTGAHGGGHEA